MIWWRLDAFLARLSFGKVRPEATRDRDSLNYFKLGTQYYVAARSATFAGCLPVAGNLFHHAVELYLKGDLCQHLARRQLKVHGHKLRRLWKSYKAMHGLIGPSAHDALIKQLDKFERIRYPDSITDRGMTAAIAVSGPDPLASIPVGGAAATPRYVIIVNDIDQLVRAVFDTTSQNPHFFFGSLSSEGRAIIYRDNPAFRAT
jgi:hypothetical protein